MKYDEWLQLEKQKPSRKKPADIEHQIQCSCICWFRVVHPDLKHMLFAVPNGGRRDKATGAKLKAEGALAGVSDLILLIPKGNYASLCIEMKTPEGTQSESQIMWQKEIEAAGSKYVICRSLDDFMSEVNSYLKG
ncbi:VRR-NUC domain-containing protein [Bacteroides sp.]|uniref:VRR-NUC domain-containing protein n=1 Tax=Bacteroides sp. TaxID=29523 RepID=UPI0026159D81|nr:VRR-NUC domain-containing protein [Bacteroides sp.]